MKTNSNSYTIIYAAIMVVVVAFLLAFVSSALKSKQDANVELDTKKQILYSLNVRNITDADAQYSQFVKADKVLAADGSLQDYTGKFVTGFEKDAKSNGNYHVFVAEVDGQTKYVFPVYGAGLWGAIWGYVAMNEDKDTVFGTYFSHASETPGLGAEIATEHFQNEFIGKKALNAGKVALSVVKNGQSKGDANKVDGISGGTMTSNGVDAMLKDCLSKYEVFLNKK